MTSTRNHRAQTLPTKNNAGPNKPETALSLFVTPEQLNLSAENERLERIARIEKAAKEGTVPEPATTVMLHAGTNTTPTVTLTMCGAHEETSPTLLDPHPHLATASTLMKDHVPLSQPASDPTEFFNRLLGDNESTAMTEANLESFFEQLREEFQNKRGIAWQQLAPISDQDRDTEIWGDDVDEGDYK